MAWPFLQLISLFMTTEIPEGNPFSMLWTAEKSLENNLFNDDSDTFTEVIMELLLYNTKNNYNIFIIVVTRRMILKTQ